jgi:2,4-dienoyl-CoA reductase-like NADH-dependent reductase (Old Yellow Enzyme family)
MVPIHVCQSESPNDVVYAMGGYIYCQLWHVSRATVFSFIEGKEILGASASNPASRARFAVAAYSCIVSWISWTVMARGGEAASRREGYLLDQFLHDNVNTRTDECGTQGLRGPTHG